MAVSSWVDSANYNTDFPVDNLPYGVFRAGRYAHIGVAIGDRILDLAGCFEDGLLHEETVTRDTLNPLMERGPEAWRALRERLTELLTEGAADRVRVAKRLVARRDAQMLLPCTVGDYTDFYASVHHATNVGSMFRPENPLLPNYKWLPVGYHGRASSIVVSGTPVRRPNGQTREGDDPPRFGPSRRLDYEMEIGAWIGTGNALGDAVPIDDAPGRIFGYSIVNDWSARDIQTWEYQPLGPFLAKNFATTVSPWIVPAAALDPYRVPRAPRADDDPQPLPHLDSDADRERGALDLNVEVSIASASMRERGMQPFRLSRGNARDLYWTFAQMIAHHTSNGCNLRPGDLLASGTVSGPTKESRGCLLELTWRGSDPVKLPTGEERRFLEDGDEVVMRAWCGDSDRRVGFGECRGIVG